MYIFIYLLLNKLLSFVLSLNVFERLNFFMAVQTRRQSVSLDKGQGRYISVQQLVFECSSYLYIQYSTKLSPIIHHFKLKLAS